MLPQTKWQLHDSAVSEGRKVKLPPLDHSPIDGLQPLELAAYNGAVFKQD